MNPWFRKAGIAAVAALAALAARAQDYPIRPLRLIVPQGPGGGSDVGARVIAERLGRALGQQIVVENRPGAGGSIGIDLACVPYKGSPQALNDLLSGQVQMVCDPLATALPQVKAGKLRILAVTSRQRSAFAPDVPTVAEAGVPDVEYTAWLCLFVPSSTPKELTARLSAELMKVLRQPETAEALTRAGLEPLALAPDDAIVIWRSDIERQAAVVKRAGMKIE